MNLRSRFDRTIQCVEQKTNINVQFAYLLFITISIPHPIDSIHLFCSKRSKSEKHINSLHYP
jgi:hypothetical protein